MQHALRLVVCAALLAGAAPAFAAVPFKVPPAAEPPKLTPAQKAFEASHNHRMKWWREARFGMFIHWGVYAVPAGTWNGQQIKKSGGEWIMNRARIPVAEYRKLTAQFNPTKFDADAWVALAKEAGMKYIVITAKHHDGFAMYGSKVDGFNIKDATPWKRDPLKELAAASKKAGIKLGFYYSQAQDWSHPGGQEAGGPWDKSAQDGDMDAYLDKVAVPQVKELLSNYGPVAVLWWDTPIGMTPERGEKFLPLLKLQPGIVMNDRLMKGRHFGDFKTPEQRIPTPGEKADQDWETCMTMNRTWGYRSYDDEWKSTEALVRNLIDIASKGGNYLLNVGPTAEGVIPDPSVKRLHEIGAWMKVNREAIYGTTGSPFKEVPEWGRVTQKVGPRGTTLFLHVFSWPKDGKLVVPGLRNKVASATVLLDGKKLTVSKGEDGGAVVAVPAAAPDPLSTTIVLKLAGPLQLS
jgi:alpha-L-fucosidase